jgi:hypothetical protein
MRSVTRSGQIRAENVEAAVLGHEGQSVLNKCRKE